jgi:NAD(P)-dependent dehydrogenase (short-subunit alcohol dehydrogenase family)
MIVLRLRRRGKRLTQAVNATSRISRRVYEKEIGLMVAQDGPVALLVGAGDAIGAAVARRFAREGYKVRMARRDAGKSRKLIEELQMAGLDIEAFSVDARKEGEVQDLFSRVEQTAGPVEVCLFNAGSNVNKAITETTDKLFFKAWELACFAGFLVGREAANYMVKRGHGTILFTGATASLRGGPGYAAVAAAQFGLRGVAQARHANWDRKTFTWCI